MHALEQGLHHHLVPVGGLLCAGGQGADHREVTELGRAHQPAAVRPDGLLRPLAHSTHILEM